MKESMMGNAITIKTQQQETQERLEEKTDTDDYQLGWASIITTGDYVFIVGSHYRLGSPDAKDKLLPVIVKQADRIIAKHHADTLTSSHKCHAATGAGRR